MGRKGRSLELMALGLGRYISDLDYYDHVATLQKKKKKKIHCEAPIAYSLLFYGI